jgi:uncharacterized protein (DUF2249 family)
MANATLPDGPRVQIVSRHFLRRRARARVAQLEAHQTGNQYTVERARRGPYRWYVVMR